LGVGNRGSEFVITLKPPERGAPRAIEPKGPIDARGADLLMHVFQFVTGKLGQQAVVDFSGVTTISSEARRALRSRLSDRAAATKAVRAFPRAHGRSNAPL
jgi:hypothetical protein